MNTQDPGSSDGINSDPQSCVSDVLLDLSVTSTRFILALQNIELSLRQRKASGDKVADDEAMEEINRRVAGHIDDIQALCGRIPSIPQEDINLCALATSGNLERPLEEYDGSEHGIELSPLNLEPQLEEYDSSENGIGLSPLNLEPQLEEYDSSENGIGLSPLNLEPQLEEYDSSENGIGLSPLNLEFPAQYLPDSPEAASPLSAPYSPPNSQTKDGYFKLGSRFWVAPPVSKDIQMRDYSTSPSTKSKTSDESKSYSCGSPRTPLYELPKFSSASCSSESSDESSSYDSPARSFSRSRMELDPDNETPSRRDNESLQDVAFWGESSESSESSESGESEDEDGDEDSVFESIHVREAPSPPKHNLPLDAEHQAGKPSSPKQHPERTPTAYKKKQNQGKSKPQERNLSLISTHLAIPRPRNYLRTTRPGPYTTNKKPRQNIQPEDAADTSDDEFSDGSSKRANYFRPRNQTPEDHKEWLLVIIGVRWRPLSEEDKQTYLSKCYQAWKCFYCQLLDLSNGCISQISRYNCPATIRREIPCYIASYDEEKRIYYWQRLPSKKRHFHKTFDSAYSVVCGKGNPKTEQQFLEWMFRSRERCLSCVLSIKSCIMGDRCKMQRLIKPESQGEEFLRTCIKCTRHQQDCMVSIQMNSGVNGEPVSYGLGRVTVGGVEELGPRFHNITKTLVVPREPQGSRIPPRNPFKSPSIRSTAPHPTKQTLKRAAPMPEHEGRNSGESSVAGAASERSRPDKTPRSIQGGSEKKREHSPTLTAQEKSKKSKVRHLPTYSSQLSFVDQLKDGHLARPPQYADSNPEPSSVMQCQYRY